MFQIGLLIFLGGGLGSLARYSVTLGVKQFSDGTIPFATLISNVLACAVMGIALGIFNTKFDSSANLKAFVVIGFCGGFSTFSTFSAETVDIFRRGEFLLGAANIVASLGLCMIVLAALIKK